jgi:hypothetical protein
MKLPSVRFRYLYPADLDPLDGSLRHLYQNLSDQT